jgi:hypothetical protein
LRSACGSNPDRLDDLLNFSRAEQRVDLRNLLPQLVAIALGEAAGDHEAPAPAIFFVLRHLEDGVDRLLLCLVDEGAGVHDEHVRVSGVARQLVAGIPSKAEHHLGVDEVLGTAEGDETDFHA